MVGAFAPVVDLVDLFLGNSAGRAVKNDFARADADDAVTVFEREVHVVDVQQNRNFIFLVDAHEVLHDLLGRDGVKGSDRLVGEDDLRILVQRAGQGHALLLTARKLAGTLIFLAL